MKAVVAERGQITIPKIFRTKLGLKAGTVIDVQLKGSTLFIVKTTVQDGLDAVYGCVKHQSRTNDIVKRLRGEE